MIMKKYLIYLRHLAFIFAAFSLIFGVSQLMRGFKVEDSTFMLFMSVIIFFFLWKNNYFTRNKDCC